MTILSWASVGPVPNVRIPVPNFTVPGPVGNWGLEQELREIVRLLPRDRFHYRPIPNSQFIHLFPTDRFDRKRLVALTRRPGIRPVDNGKQGLWLKSGPIDCQTGEAPDQWKNDGLELPLGLLDQIFPLRAGRGSWFDDRRNISTSDASVDPVMFFEKYHRGLLNIDRRRHPEKFVAELVRVLLRQAELSQLADNPDLLGSRHGRFLIACESNRQVEEILKFARLCRIPCTRLPRQNDGVCEYISVWGASCSRGNFSRGSRVSMKDLTTAGGDPAVIAGTWNDCERFLDTEELRNDFSMIALAGDALIEPRGYVRKACTRIPPRIPFYGVVSGLDHYSHGARDGLTHFWGPHQCDVITLGRFAYPVRVTFEGGTRSGRARRDTDRKPKSRNKKLTSGAFWGPRCNFVGKVAGRFADRSAQRCAVTAFNDRHVAELLLHLPNEFIGFCEDPGAVLNLNRKRYRKLKRRMHSIPGLGSCSSDGQSAYLPSSAEFVVIALDSVRRAGFRDVWIRADAGVADLNLSAQQRTVAEKGQRIRVIDLCDPDDKLLAARSRKRRTSYCSSWRYQVDGAKQENGEPAIERMPLQSNLPYTSGGLNGLHGHNVHSARSATRRGAVRQERIRHRMDGGCVIDEIAEVDVLKGIVEEVCNPGLHGQTPGPEDVVPCRLARDDKLALAIAVSNLLFDNQWIPGPTRQVEIPKSRGGSRTIEIANVADRVVCKALANALSARRTTSPGISWTIRGNRWSKGRGRLQMLASIVARVDTCASKILQVVDIKDAFPTVPTPEIMSALRAQGALKQPPEKWPDYSREGQNASRRWRDRVFFKTLKRAIYGIKKQARGISQGSSLSPVLLDFFLHHFVDPIPPDQDPPYAVWRYVDDIVILTATEERSMEVSQLLQTRLEEHGMALRPTTGSPVDLGSGRPVRVLGLDLVYKGGEWTFQVPQASWQRFEEGLERCVQFNNVPNSARSYIRGWLAAHAPAAKAGGFAKAEIRKRLKAFMPGVVTDDWLSEAILSAEVDWRKCRSDARKLAIEANRKVPSLAFPT